MGCAHAQAAALTAAVNSNMLASLMARVSRPLGAYQVKPAIVLAGALASFAAIGANGAHAQGAAAMPPPIDVVFVCPFDRSIRSLEPGDCVRRGRRADLVAEVPAPIEF